jgi:catechol 2,3-dioxygenase-like lactoylglutathione lyase family enzyme
VTLNLKKPNPFLIRKRTQKRSHFPPPRDAAYNACMALRNLILPAACAAALVPCLLSQRPDVKRPPILGVAHLALKTNDLAAARAFYGHDLGFEEPFPGPNGGAIFKVNDHQYIEVANTLKDDSEDRLEHIAFETTNARQLRDYLASKGVKVPDTVEKNADGDYSFVVADPEAHNIEFVEYGKGSLRSRNFGKALPATRISDRIIHAGFTIQDPFNANRFYGAILGYHETWHGGMQEARTDWVDMRVPDGADWLEYMLNQPHPSTRTRGVMNHLALGVPDAQAAYKTLQDRQVKMQEQPKIGRDGKWQLNLYDPNLTRAELMEPKPVQPPCCSSMLDH